MVNKLVKLFRRLFFIGKGSNTPNNKLNVTNTNERDLKKNTTEPTPEDDISVNSLYDWDSSKATVVVKEESSGKTFKVLLEDCISIREEKPQYKVQDQWTDEFIDIFSSAVNSIAEANGGYVTLNNYGQLEAEGVDLERIYKMFDREDKIEEGGQDRNKELEKQEQEGEQEEEEEEEDEEEEEVEDEEEEEVEDEEEENATVDDIYSLVVLECHKRGNY
jgi:hypothetical protein